ncbi:hypothetical protein BSL78_22900 [Apostichopus japonicus]|uniref:Uncharacterized protein n=1 Tax=Stichopus japonicus TaxID=307972 RepID=A0A2G8JX11_STIJA|nr:hypothetical protein BSL78_22900 [Apostichopus japonicus]
MAGDRRVTNGNGVNERFENNDGEQSDSNLRDFISQEFQNQRVSSQTDSNNVSDERATQFLQRAINESQRMAAETSRSQRRRQQLYEELGKERFEQWTREHLEETIRDAVRKADEDAMSVER